MNTVNNRLGNPASGLVGDLLIRDRTIYIVGNVNTAMSYRFVSELLFLAREDAKKPIYVLLDSVGGYVTPGLAMIDAINLVKPDVHITCIGWAVSMGAVLLSAGAKGHRSAFPNCQIMIHQPSSSNGGTVADQKIEMAETERLKDLLAKILADNTGKTKEQILKDFDRNFYMTSEQAKDYGLIDRVTGPKEFPA